VEWKDGVKTFLDINFVQFSENRGNWLS